MSAPLISGIDGKDNILFQFIRIIASKHKRLALDKRNYPEGNKFKSPFQKVIYIDFPPKKPNVSFPSMPHGQKFMHMFLSQVFRNFKDFIKMIANTVT